MLSKATRSLSFFRPCVATFAQQPQQLQLRQQQQQQQQCRNRQVAPLHSSSSRILRLPSGGGGGGGADNDDAEKSRRERVLTVPNVLSLSRIVATPVLGYMIVHGQYPWALGLFVAAGLTDLLDGWIARTWDQRTVFGAALDPFADKLLVTTLTLSLFAAGLLPLPLTALIIARDGGLMITGFALRYMSLPAPKTLRRYFDIQLPSVDLKPSNLSKANTALQLLLLAASLASPVFAFEDHVALAGLRWVVAATTFGSGIDYIFNARKYVTFVKHTK